MEITHRVYNSAVGTSRAANTGAEYASDDEGDDNGSADFSPHA